MISCMFTLNVTLAVTVAQTNARRLYANCLWRMAL